MNSQNVSSPVRAFDAAVAVLLNATGDYAAANSSRFGTGKRVSTQATPPSTGSRSARRTCRPPTAGAALGA
jgi:hypothetical protein